MNHPLAVAPRRVLPDAMPMPPMGRALAAAVDAIERPHPDIPMPYAYRSDIVAEAARVLGELRERCGQVTREQVTAWLAPLPAVVRNPPAKEELADWMAGVMIAVGDMEACLFNAETQRSAIREWRFWPSAADVYGLLAASQMPLRNRLWALGMIARSEAVP